MLSKFAKKRVSLNLSSQDPLMKTKLNQSTTTFNLHRRSVSQVHHLNATRLNSKNLVPSRLHFELNNSTNKIDTGSVSNLFDNNSNLEKDHTDKSSYLSPVKETGFW